MNAINWTESAAKEGIRGKEHEGRKAGSDEIIFLIVPMGKSGRYQLLNGEAEVVCSGSSIKTCKGFAERIESGELVKLASGNYADKGTPKVNLREAFLNHPDYDPNIRTTPEDNPADEEWNPTPDEYPAEPEENPEPELMTAANQKTKKDRKPKAETPLEVPPQLKNGTLEPATEPVKGRVGAKGKRKASKETAEKLVKEATQNGSATVGVPDDEAKETIEECREAVKELNETPPLTEEQRQEAINLLVWNKGIKPINADLEIVGLTRSDLTPTAMAKAERYVQKRLKDERDELPAPKERSRQGLVRVWALSGPGPEVELKGGSPKQILDWVEDVRDWGESKNNYITASAFINLAGKFPDGGVHAIPILRRMLKTELEAEHPFRKQEAKAATEEEKGEEAKPSKVNVAEAKPSKAKASKPKRAKAESDGPVDKFGSPVNSNNAKVNAILGKEALTASDICKKTGLTSSQVRYSHLNELVANGHAVKVGKGWKLA